MPGLSAASESGCRDSRRQEGQFYNDKTAQTNRSTSTRRVSTTRTKSSSVATRDIGISLTRGLKRNNKQQNQSLDRRKSSALGKMTHKDAIEDPLRRAKSMLPHRQRSLMRQSRYKTLSAPVLQVLCAK